jgi:hypothetical protein
MKFDRDLTNEYLEQVNQLLTQDDYAKGLYDLFTPLRNLLLSETDLLPFSLAKYAGADNRVAFFSQWFYLTVKLINEPNTLTVENQKYFIKKVPLRFRGVPNLDQLVDTDIKNIFQPRQSAILFLKTRDLADSILKEHSSLEKYLGKEYLKILFSSEVASVKKLYVEQQSVSEFLQVQGERTAFAKLGLPCLVGFTMYFNKPENKHIGQSIKWVLLDETLRLISALHETSNTQELQKFVYASRLGEKEEFLWLQKPSKEQHKIAMESSDAREITKELRSKLASTAQNNLQFINLPNRYLEMVEDLLNWVRE